MRATGVILLSLVAVKFRFTCIILRHAESHKILNYAPKKALKFTAQKSSPIENFHIMYFMGRWNRPHAKKGSQDTKK